MYLLTMNRLDLLTKIYGGLHKYPGVPYWFLSPFRRLTRSVSNHIIPSYLSHTRKNRRNAVHSTPVIVSFTSFPARINNAWQVVECMLRQSYLPAKIILWLSKDQFATVESIPQSLREREGDLFEIRMVDGDIRSHKKYLYTFREFYGRLVLLIDDDLYYPTDLIERLLREFQIGESSVICNYGYEITYNESSILPYMNWEKEYNYSTSPNLFFGSGGGTLIDTSKLNQIVQEIELALQLAPTADDIWLNAIVRYSGMKMTMLKNGSILPVYNEKNEKLSTGNLGDSQNDIQLKNVMKYFSDNEGIELFSQR